MHPPGETHVPAATAASIADARGSSSSEHQTLGDLLVALASSSERIRDEAWARCYDRYRDLVWTRVFYVVRQISWLREPREVAEDVTSEVFVSLPEAARNYRESGKAEQWLKHLAVRAALRAREKLTGDWNRGKRGAGAPRAGARRYSSFDDEADMIVRELDGIETEEILELDRRVGALRSSPDARLRRWADFIDLYRAGYGFHEIGERLGLSEGTARNWLVEIRKHLAAPPNRAEAK